MPPPLRERRASRRGASGVGRASEELPGPCTALGAERLTGSLHSSTRKAKPAGHGLQAQAQLPCWLAAWDRLSGCGGSFLIGADWGGSHFTMNDTLIQKPALRILSEAGAVHRQGQWSPTSTRKEELLGHMIANLYCQTNLSKSKSCSLFFFRKHTIYIYTFLLKQTICL